MYGYIYETENLVNHKKYIGKKASSIFLPEYHGSGTILLEAVAKYGEHNFKTHVLEWCESLEQLNEKERYYIRINNAVDSSNYYNIANGGDGGDVTLGWTEERRDKFRQKMSSITEGRVAITNDSKLKYVSPDELEKYIAQGWRIGGLTKSSEARKKIAEKLRGSRYVTNGVNNLKVDLEDTDRINSLFDQGYRFGFTYTEKQREARDFRHEQFLQKQKSQVEDYLNSTPICETCGRIITKLYSSGRYCSEKCAKTHPHTQETKELLSSLNKKGVIGNKGRTFSEEHKQKIGESIKTYYKSSEQRMWINNGIVSKRIAVSEFTEFSKQGYSKGRLKDPNYVPWNKGLTIADPRVRKNLDSRNATMFERYGSLNTHRKKEN